MVIVWITTNEQIASSIQILHKHSRNAHVQGTGLHGDKDTWEIITHSVEEKLPSIILKWVLSCVLWFFCRNEVHGMIYYKAIPVQTLYGDYDKMNTAVWSNFTVNV